VFPAVGDLSVLHLECNAAVGVQLLPVSLAGLGIRTRPVYWDTTLADAIVADWLKVLIGVRRDFTLEVSAPASFRTTRATSCSTCSRRM
jgi:hypothetical protein